jgi:hypothetical protein
MSWVMMLPFCLCKKNIQDPDVGRHRTGTDG